jgi:hypothetical protein
MRRLGLRGSELGEVLGWGASGKGAVGAVVVVEMLEGLDVGGELLEGERQLMAGVELVAPAAIAALDGAPGSSPGRAIEFGRSGRQDEQPDAALGAGGLELGHELAAAVDLDGVERERQLGREPVEEQLGGLGGGAVERGGDGPPGDRVTRVRLRRPECRLLR